MSNICFHCGKGVLHGRSHTHHRGVAGGRWKKRAQKTNRVFEPNLHKVQVMVEGVKQSVKMCSKCLKRVKKDLTDGKRPFVNVVHYASIKPTSTVSDAPVATA